MSRTIGIGRQDFEKIRVNHNFYVDKTDFIRQWWEASDDVTLIVRPRRFGKTLNMSMVEQFFSIAYAGRVELVVTFLAVLELMKMGSVTLTDAGEDLILEASEALRTNTEQMAEEIALNIDA